MISQNDKAKFKKDFIRRLINLGLDGIKLCRELKKDNLFWSVCDQLLRSICSIGANVVEAQSASSKKDYIKFFEIALKSANETKYWLILIQEVDPISKNKSTELLKEIEEISKIIGAGVLTMKNRR